MKKMITVILFFLITTTYSQSVVIGTGAEMEVATGADVCATDYGNISGNLTGVGTQCNSALPVELISFTANFNNKSILLNWQTATEVDNYGFSVERSTKIYAVQDVGRGGVEEWKEIGFVQGHGNSNSPKTYSFSDLNPTFGTLCYRLKQIDTDGMFAYSQIAEVSWENNVPTQFVLEQNYPNPFNPTTTIKFGLPESGFVDLRVYNVLGEKVVQLINKEMNEGYHEVKFNALHLSSGIYFYSINVEDNFYSINKMVLIK